MSYSKKVASNTIVQLFGRMLSTAISFFIIAFLTRKLGVHGYGEYSIVFAYLGFFSVIADFGFFYLLVRKLSANEGDPKETASNLITMRSVAALTVFLFSIALVQFLPYSTNVKQAVVLATISFFVVSIQNTLFGIFQAYYQMRYAVVADNLSRIITLAFIYFATQANITLSLVIWGYVLGNFTGTIFLIYRARKIVPFGLAFNWKLWKSIFRESLAFGAAIVFSYLYFKVDALMLSLMKGPTDVGIYAPGVKIIEVVLILPQMFIGTILPIYSLYIANKDQRLNQTIQKTFDLLSLAMVGVVGGVFALSSQIVNLIAGPEFLSASTVSINGVALTAASSLSLLIFTVALSYLNPTFNYLLIAAGKQKLLVLPNVIFLIFNVSINYFLIPKYSYMGAAFSTVITEIIVLATVIYISKRELKYQLSISRLVRALVAGVVMVAFIKLTNLPLLADVVIGGLIYLVGAYLLGAVRPEMLSILRRKEV